MAWALRARAPAASLRTSHSHLRAPVCDRSGGRASIDRAAAHLSGGQRWQRGRGRQVMALNWLISWLWHADGDCEAVWLPPTKSRARELARVLVVPRRRVSARHPASRSLAHAPTPTCRGSLSALSGTSCSRSTRPDSHHTSPHRRPSPAWHPPKPRLSPPLSTCSKTGLLLLRVVTAAACHPPSR